MSGYEEDKIRKNGIEEDAFNKEARSNGVEDDAFNEEMADDGQIKDSLDSIEPASGAKERMLANIRRKAAAAEPAGSESAAPVSPVRTAEEMIKAEERPVKAEPAEAPKKKSAARTWMWVVPALATVAAAVVILYVAGAFPKGKKEKLETTPSGETEVSRITAGGTTDVSGIITGGPITECRSQEEMESFLKFSVKVPEDAESPKFFIEDGQVGVVEYKIGEKKYTLYAARNRELLELRKTGRTEASWEEDGVFYMKAG